VRCRFKVRRADREITADMDVAGQLVEVVAYIVDSCLANRS
jgi:hypothetical protein